MKHLKRILITLLVAAIIGGIGYAFVQAYRERTAQLNGAPQVFSSNRMLLELWGKYKLTVLEEGSGRTLDKSMNNITTSEGQSYTMMRAVWMDDRTEFDRSWKWTKDNMQRDDSLMSWKFGQIDGDTYGIQTASGGQNTATDADVDIAFALLMASARWKEFSYRGEAMNMLNSIWDSEVVIINGEPVLAANDIERFNQASIIVNPSYFAPYAYRVFAKFDPTHNWTGLVDSSYRILGDASASPLDKSTSSGLIPDWIRVSRATGEVIPAPEYTSNYSYDALRTPWRLGLDWNYYKEPRAKQMLETAFKPLGDGWTNEKKLAAIYSHDGTIIDPNANPAMYGGSQAYFDIVHPETADDFYTRNLVVHYSPDKQSYTKELQYYDDNWVWFGMAFHDGALVNLTELASE